MTPPPADWDKRACIASFQPDRGGAIADNTAYVTQAFGARVVSTL